MVDTSAIKEIRDRTGISVKEIKKALEKSDGDKEKALKILKEHGASVAQKRSGRETGEGVIEAYIHGTKKVGALIWESKNIGLLKIEKRISIIQSP